MCMPITCLGSRPDDPVDGVRQTAVTACDRWLEVRPHLALPEMPGREGHPNPGHLGRNGLIGAEGAEMRELGRAQI